MQDFEAGIKAAAWPTHDPSLFFNIADMHEQQATSLDEAARTSYTTFRPRFAQALSGQAGEAQLTSHDENVALWQRHAEQHRGAAAAANEVGREHAQLRHELGLLIDEGQPKYDQAVGQKQPAAAVEIYAGYRAEAVGLATETAGRITGILGTNPLSPAPDPGNKGGKGGKGDKDGKGPWSADDPTQDPASDPSGKPDPVSGKGDSPAPWSATDPTAASPPPAHEPSVPTSPLGAGGSGSAGSGASSAMSGVSSAGSGIHAPSSSLSGLSSGLTSPGLTSPASVASSEASSVPRAVAMPNVAGAFSSGVQSGLGAGAPAAAAGGPGAAGFAPAQYPQPPLAPFASAQPAVAAPASAPAPASAAAAAPAAPASGSGAGGSMMAAPIAAGQPMAPYSMPGAGGAPTGVAASAGSAVQSPGVASGGGAPLVAGTGGAAGSSGLAASSSEPDHNMIRARAVLDGLVRGTDLVRLPSQVMWAVAVVEAATAPQVVIANNIGGGGYLPSTVYLPVGARLAVGDPALPRGWAGDELMGWQRPTVIIERYYERLREAPVYGVRVLAVATTEMWPRRLKCGGSFAALTDREILHGPGEAPELDGWHQHRLEVIDPGLRARVDALISATKADAVPQLQRDLAVGATAAVLAAAAEPDATGQRLSLAADEQLWAQVTTGEATDDHWQTWAEQSDEARDLPEVHAPQDPDDSAASRSARIWYRHWYRSARVAELLQCWQPGARHGVSTIYDALYCGLTAGFADQVATVISDVERRYAQKR